ncbi:MAG: hypothetical protein Q9163_000966 [Psora crenata]
MGEDRKVRKTKMVPTRDKHDAILSMVSKAFSCPVVNGAILLFFSDPSYISRAQRDGKDQPVTPASTGRVEESLSQWQLKRLQEQARGYRTRMTKSISFMAENSRPEQMIRRL